MRRFLSAMLVLGVLAGAGCGGGDDSGSALDSVLAFLPKDTTFVVAIDTDTDGDQFQALGELLDKFPFGDQFRSSLRDQLEQSSGGVSFNDDLKPVLGNPLVVGSPDQQAINGATSFVVAFQAKDKDALDELVDKLGARKTGEASGATLYSRDGDVFAVKDDVVVSANDEALLKQALERAEGDDHFDEDAFNEGLDGLPESAVARVYANVEALLKADPSSADARKVKWIASLRTLGLTASAKNDSIDIDFRLRTEGDLADEDLPVAPGGEAPPVIKRDGEVGLGIRDLAHIVKFAENAAQAIDPAGFGDYAQAKQTIDKQLGVSLDDDLIGQLTGNLAASAALGGDFGLRSELKDPRAFERTLAKVADVLPSFAEGAGLGTVALSKPKAGEDFYALAQPDGDSIVFGVVGDVLVVSSDPARASRLATEEPTAVEGATGSVVMSADAEQIVNTLLRQFGPALGLPDLGGLGAGLVTGPLGDLTGHAEASQDELRGKLSLAIE
jgi:hypothetical protein